MSRKERRIRIGGTATLLWAGTLLAAGGCTRTDTTSEESAAPSPAAAGADQQYAGTPAAAGSADAQPVSEACADEPRRQFDFWLGRWAVVNPAGDTVGVNEISRVADGCGLLESWRGRGGSRGTSLNLYDPLARRWEQHWTGGDGLILHLDGELRNGSMVLGGPRPQAEGPELVDRITWTPLDAGRVRQLWETSEDGGASWRTVFDGLYLPT